MNKFNEIRPSAEQEKCINYAAGDLLVNGLPGAGKSIVLLKRAMKYYKDSNPGEENLIFLTTFNNTLNKYTKDIFQQADIDEKRMSIRTMDSYCGHIYYEHFGRFHTVEHAERPKYVVSVHLNQPA